MSPGPGAYEGSNLNQLGSNAPKVSIKGRPQTAKPIDLPGPG